MKKIIAILMACLFILSFTTAFAESEKTLSIVCTTFPQYDWVRQILGDHVNDVDLTLLMDNGVDLHNYQPTADDIIKIAQSDLFIYVGGDSDGSEPQPENREYARKRRGQGRRNGRRYAGGRARPRP